MRHQIELDTRRQPGRESPCLATDKPSSIDDYAECTTRAVKDFCAEYGVAESAHPRLVASS